ncbi:MAG: sigma-70 family RNA polymerase sigma factor [Actinomycetota bacterium]|nr:sigma-70 family RNA polymerase sigma factor [Actinomycetota bacterium]
MTTQELSEKPTTHGRRQDARRRQELVDAHAGLACHLAHRFAGRGEELDDLMQVARLALVKAANRYDPDRRTSFSTFATPTIVGELKRHFRDRGWSVSVPRRLQEHYLAAGRAGEILRHELGRSPTVEEVATSVGTSTDTVKDALAVGQSYRALSLDAPPRPDSSQGSAPMGAEDDDTGRVEDRMCVAQLLESLSDQERRLVRLRFFEDLTQAEIAAQESTSEAAISKTLGRAVHRLRRAAVVDSSSTPGGSGPGMAKSRLAA